MQSYKKNITFPTNQSFWQVCIAVLSHAGFLTAIGLAAWFHDLRSTFGESAEMLCNLILAPDFSVKSCLSIDWFQNLATLTAIRSHASLWVVSIVFSTAPMVFAYLVFIACYYGLNRKFSGIFLILLFLGVNFSFFDAVNPVYTGLCSIYGIVALFDFIFYRYYTENHKNNSFIWNLVWFGLFALIGLVGFHLPPMLYTHTTWAYCCFSPIQYLTKEAVNTYILVGIFAILLCLFWLAKKQYRALYAFLAFGISVLALAVWQTGFNGFRFAFDYEKLFLPFVAVVLTASIELFLSKLQITKRTFGILCGLVFLAVGGLLRNLPEFENRQNNVITLLKAANAIQAEKIAFPENFQQIEKYISPTYLAFETTLISAFYDMPLKSIYVIPEGLNFSDHADFRFADTLQKSRYFSFSDSSYAILDKPLIPRKLFADFLCNTESVEGSGKFAYYFPPEDTTVCFTQIPTQTDDVFSGNSSVFTGPDLAFAFNFSLRKLQRGDSVEISVWRKGSDGGFLVVSSENSDHIWFAQQTTSKPDERGWQKLSSTFILNQKKYRLLTYAWNANYQNEIILFDDFQVKIWRE